MKKCWVLGVCLEQYKIINQCAKELMILCDGIGQEDLNKLVKEKVAGDEVGYQENENFKEIMIFNEVSKEEVVQFINRLKNKGLEYRGTIGVINENNSLWTIGYFLEELYREHQLIQKINELWMDMQELNQHDLTQCSEKEKNKIMAVYLFLQQPKEEDLDYHKKELLQILSKFKEELPKTSEI